LTTTCTQEQGCQLGHDECVDMRVKILLEIGDKSDGSQRIPGRERFNGGRTTLIRAQAIKK
jgi:hypothetical protein